MSKFDNRMRIQTPGKNVFPLSYKSKLTAASGFLYPVMCKEVIPGDRFRLNLAYLCRLAPLYAPVIDDLKINFRAFFCQNRILDPEWKKFITAGSNLGGYDNFNEIAPLNFVIEDTSFYNERQVVPTYENIDIPIFGIGGLMDHLNFHFASYTSEGFPEPLSISGTATLRPVSFYAGPVLAYNKVYEDWYRNERLQPALFTEFIEQEYDGVNRRFSTGDNLAGNASRFLAWKEFFSLKKHNYAKDRYTTALPEPVIGGPVEIGFNSSGSDTVPVTTSDGGAIKFFSYATTSDRDKFGILYAKHGNGFSYLSSANRNSVKYKIQDDGTLSGSSVSFADKGVDVYNDTATSLGKPLNLVAQVGSAASIAVQQIKTAFRMYSFFMKDTYNGNRYVEFMQSHYDVVVPDATLDRTIYLGSFKSNISFGEVFQTAPDGAGDSSAVGDYAGRGLGAGDGFVFDRSFLEHGYLMVIMDISPRAKYYQGIDKKFLKGDRFDFFFPEFQNIGDVPITSKELYFNPGYTTTDQTETDPTNDNIFGYQSRWYEYKEYLDEIHGEFLTTLDTWHFGRRFETRPVLGSDFISITTDNRQFSLVGEYQNNYEIDLLFQIKSLRPIYRYESF